MEIQNYKLSLEIDFDTLDIIGHEKITLTAPSNELVLDCYNLEIKSVSDINGKEIHFNQNAKNLVLKEISTADGTQSITIGLEYHGKVSDKSLHGIYKSSYNGGYFVATDFEPNGARLMFPCVDDPRFKAEFDIEVVTQSGLVVTSNCREKRVSRVDEKRTRHVFERTPRMSTYLLYVGIGNFEISTLEEPGSTELRVLTKPGDSRKGDYALENSAKFLKLYGDYYNVPYPLPRLDLIALPEYAAGAMENWGAITFREVLLLVDKNSSASNRRSVVEVAGHEIAHQWFGDLVTMEWWNDLWLNESFATFMESKMTDVLYPEWNIWSDFLHDQTSGAMIGDSLHNTHPIDVNVKDPEEVSQIFDEISYGKGASILRMIEAWMGEEKFRGGIRKYLAEYPFSNAKGEDLWIKLEQSSQLPVSRVMRSWVKDPGFPVVKASLRDGGVYLEQERFFLKKKSGSEDYQWPIPLVSWINGRSSTMLFEGRSATFPLKEPLSVIKINAGQSGFYRVLYDAKLYSLVKEELHDLTPFDRWGVISDLFAFLISGGVKLEMYFDFVRQSTNDIDYLVVDTIASQLEFLRALSPDNETLRGIYIDYHRWHIERLGLEPKTDESDNDKILRGRIATGLVLADEQFAKKISSRFSSYEQDDPNLRTAIAISFAITNPESSYDTLIATLKRSANEADLSRIFKALTSYHDPNLVERALDFSISGQVNRADSLYAIFGAIRNPRAKAVTWQWIKKNLGTMLELFRGTSTIPSLLQEAIPRVGIGQEDEVKKYFLENKIEEADKGIAKGIELLDAYSDLAGRLS
jgi:tricorn protease interacting factor F2/3